MTHHTQNIALDQIGELLAEHGFDGMTQALVVLRFGWRAGIGRYSAVGA